MCVCDSDACERVPTCVDALYADELMSMFRVWRHENMQSSKTLTAASDLRPAAFLSSLDPAAQCVCVLTCKDSGKCVCVCVFAWMSPSPLRRHQWAVWIFQPLDFFLGWVDSVYRSSPEPWSLTLDAHTHTHTHIHGFLSVVGHLRMSFILHLDFSTLTLTKNRFSLRNQLKHISSGSSWNYND